MASSSVRVDTWLWATRQLKSRSQATAAARAGHVRVNGVPVKAAHKLSVGDEVRLRIGTPLLADVFHPNRWEYVFRFQYPNGESELRRVTVFFADNRVTDIKHDPLPARDDPNDPALPGYQPKETEKS